MPEELEFEITLIGTGGGYGESIVIHIGNNEWIIVDSCINPTNNSILPLEYLVSIGVDAKSSVKLIVCTHWHDDHIRGISKILEICENANLSFTKVNDRKKFLRFIGLDYSKLTERGILSSTKEFGKCLEIIEKSNRKIIGAYPDRLIYKTELESNIFSKIYTLSPSDRSIDDFDFELSKLITEFGERRRKTPNTTPNDKSVVLLLQLGNHNILLGADLEVNKSTDTGWDGIINHSTIISENKSSYFKIPHHGSENGYHTEIWNLLLLEQPNATLTPWNRNNKLPNMKMVGVYVSHTKNLYITSSNINLNKPKKRDKDIEKIIKKFEISLREEKFDKGIIRSRIKNEDVEWRTELFDAAIKIT